MLEAMDSLQALLEGKRPSVRRPEPEPEPEPEQVFAHDPLSDAVRATLPALAYQTLQQANSMLWLLVQHDPDFAHLAQSQKELVKLIEQLEADISNKAAPQIPPPPPSVYDEIAEELDPETHKDDDGISEDADDEADLAAAIAGTPSEAPEPTPETTQSVPASTKERLAMLRELAAKKRFDKAAMEHDEADTPADEEAVPDRVPLTVYDLPTGALAVYDPTTGDLAPTVQAAPVEIEVSLPDPADYPEEI